MEIKEIYGIVFCKFNQETNYAQCLEECSQCADCDCPPCPDEYE